MEPSNATNANIIRLDPKPPKKKVVAPKGMMFINDVCRRLNEWLNSVPMRVNRMVGDSNPVLISEMLGISDKTVRKYLNNDPNKYKQKSYTPIGRAKYRKVSEDHLKTIEDILRDFAITRKEPFSQDILNELDKRTPGGVGFSLTTLQHVLKKEGLSRVVKGQVKYMTRDKIVKKKRPKKTAVATVVVEEVQAEKVSHATDMEADGGGHES